MRTSTIDRVDDARRRDGELAIPIRHEGRVLEDRLLAAAARSFQKDLRVRVVGHDGPPTTLDLGRAEGELVGDGHDLDTGATLDDVRDAVTMDEETERISRRVFGGAHPLTMMIEVELRAWRAALRTLETLPPGAW